MTALSQDTDPARRIAELEQRLQSSAAENGRLQRELALSRERQAAGADILATIAGVSGDADQALQQIAETTARLFGASSVSIQLAENSEWGKSYRYGASAQRIRAAVPLADIKVGGRNLPGAVVGRNQQIHAPDLDHLEGDLAEFPGLPHARAAGTRTICGTPLRNKGKAIGALIIHRDRLEPFSAEELALQQSFADQAAIAIENARLFNETREALERQTATADILKVIASSPSDVQPVFEAIATSSKRLIGGFSTAVFRFVDDVAHLVAFTPTTPAADDVLKAGFSPVDRFEPFKLAQAGKPVQIADIEALPDSQIKQIARARGFRSMLFTPLMSSGVPIGLISVTRIEVGAFLDHHVQLLQTFADQAVIAIENARLFEEVQARTRDLTEALERQTATSEVLSVISRSPSDLRPVLETISETAARLCGSEQTMFFRFDGEVFRILASWNFPPEVHEMLSSAGRCGRGIPSAVGRAGASLKPVCIPDVLADPAYGLTSEQNRARYRTTLGVPLVREGRLIGAISLNRSEPNSFTDRHIELVAMFADQAVIAIENTRLFDEVQAKTRELTEALTYQTGSAQILKVIASSPTEAGPALRAIVESACELCDAYDAAVVLKDGDFLRFSAHHGPIPIGLEKWPINRLWTAGRAFIDQTPVHIEDLRDEKYADLTDGRELSIRMGHRSILSVPLLRETESIGAIVLRRKEVHAFTDKQIALLQSFADQAVIAIGNVRLFEEVQARTREVSEALTYQTGSANILKVIASSPTDVGPVLRTIVDSACELCEAYDAVLVLKEDRYLAVRAHHGPIEMGAQTWPDDRTSVSGRAIADRAPIHLHDVLSGEGADFPVAQAMSRHDGCHTILAVPMLSESESIGAIVLRRKEVHAFTDKQIALLQSFADQAVIAIGNVRLFEQVQARTRDLTEALQQQTATADVLKVISRSAFDLQSVLDTLVASASTLCNADQSMLLLFEDGVLKPLSYVGPHPDKFEFRKSLASAPHRGTVSGRAVLDRETAHVPDVLSDPEFTNNSWQELTGFRAMLAVPLMRQGQPIGAMALSRTAPGAFTDRQVDLVQTFADQAVIALENVRLFEQVQARTTELGKSLDELRAAQDRLVQTEKLASLGQLTAGIAHEIKNPLNFVNNFSALSAELIDELNDLLGPAALDDKTRAEVDELAEMLKGNLDKVVQHGKRADSIVRNMLLHSAQGSGERRPADVNAIVEESLNLAYHGARAEKSGFNITLKRDFDSNAGVADVYPQEITRVLLNLISNGFYAATKRKEAAGGFGPTLSATTRAVDGDVEIRIRDNGSGIPADVLAKIFNPFFTTKPAGEGTGLGLSMSHDIIVKQHRGRIDVETEPGGFTEFIIRLPRTWAAQGNIGGGT